MFRRVMSGDAAVPDPNYTTTLAIDIAARPERIWPWLVQMGYQRGGLYSFDWLDRLFGFLDRPSADRILPEFQHLQPGDVIPIGRGPGFPVRRVEPNRTLVLAGEANGTQWSWELALYPIDGGRTRLVSRSRARIPGTFRPTVFRAALRPAAYIMTKRMLVGLKRRAEGALTRSVRATPSERTKPLPGDDVIANPLGILTHAVTIDRPPGEIWPWLAQMGAGRAGWYSYDRLDNGGHPSAERIIPELQQLVTDMVFPALPGRQDGFTLIGQEPGRFLLLCWRLPDHKYLMTWAFVLEPIDATHTRLIVRARGGAAYRFHGLPPALSALVVRPIHFLMERKQLLGLAWRVEHQ